MKSVKEGNHCPRTSQQSLLTRVGIDYYALHPKYLSLSSFQMDKRNTFLEKNVEEAWRQRRR
jgi:hypothetical protein